MQIDPNYVANYIKERTGVSQEEAEKLAKEFLEDYKKKLGVKNG